MQLRVVRPTGVAIPWMVSQGATVVDESYALGW